MRIHRALSVCTDCHVTDATGEVPPDLPADSPRPWSMFTPDPGEHPVHGVDEHSEHCTQADRAADRCDCAVEPFTWRPCDACGSPLAGERHAYVTLVS